VLINGFVDDVLW